MPKWSYMSIPFLPGNKTADLEKRIEELEKAVFDKTTPPHEPSRSPKRNMLAPLSLFSVEKNGMIPFKWLLELSIESKSEAQLPVIFGISEYGRMLEYDLVKAPHILIGGTTGSGKTVFLISLITSLLLQKTHEELRFIIVDPKRVEMPEIINKLPHLLTPVIHDVEKALSALRWTVGEMENRFKQFAGAGVQNIESYNALEDIEKKPYIIFIIDELADLMLFHPKQIEELVIRLAMMSRATGIHLILSTQRPSKDVLRPMIRAHIPTHIAFNVSSIIDSKVIIDQAGAETLYEPGDMLFLPPDMAKPLRVHAPKITEKEFISVIEWIIKHQKEDTLPTREIEIKEEPATYGYPSSDDKDPLFEEAVKIISLFDKASASLIQRRLKVGYARAARLLDELEAEGFVGPPEGAKPREILKKPNAKK